MMETISGKIERLLKEKLGATVVQTEDDSWLHAGHNPKGGGGHYRLRVVSPLFSGKTLLERHRLVNDVVFSEMEGLVHALAIKALTPEEWKEI